MGRGRKGEGEFEWPSDFESLERLVFTIAREEYLICTKNLCSNILFWDKIYIIVYYTFSVSKKLEKKCTHANKKIEKK